MRNVLSVAAAFLTGMWAGQAAAQQNAIGTRLSDYGVFLGLDTRFGDITSEFAAFAGGEVALLLKHRVYLGVRGAGLVTDNARIPGGAASVEPLGMGYGGLLVGFIIPTRSLVNISVDALMGAGGLGSANASDDREWDAVFVFEPSTTLDLRLARLAQIGIGAAYRFVGDVDVPGMHDSELRGFTGLVRLRVGWF